MTYKRRKLMPDSKYEIQVTDGHVEIFRNGEAWLEGPNLPGVKAWIEVADILERLEEQGVDLYRDLNPVPAQVFYDDHIDMWEDHDSRHAPDWYEIRCGIDFWQTDGRESVVEAAAWEHVTEVHGKEVTV